MSRQEDRDAALASARVLPPGASWVKRKKHGRRAPFGDGNYVHQLTKPEPYAAVDDAADAGRTRWPSRERIYMQSLKAAVGLSEE